VELITRDAAKAIGLSLFFTGIPCKHGHIAERMVSDGKCYPCRKAVWEGVRRRRGQKPFKANEAKRIAKDAGEPFFVDGVPCPKGHMERRWTHNGLCVPCSIAASKAHAKSTGYLHAKLWNAANNESLRKHKSARRARVRSASGSFTAKDVKRLLKIQKHKCANCKTPLSQGYHIDHMMPLALGGSNDASNIQMLCPSCNRKKCAKHPLIWARENGRLL
jgi:RNase P subunit RPR2